MVNVNGRKLLLDASCIDDGVANLFVEEAAVKDDAGVVVVKLDDVIQVLSLLQLIMKLKTSAVKNLQ